ncbi:MAG TPA: alpha/beta hydrolase [Streptosporangiaceae bacterium]
MTQTGPGGGRPPVDPELIPALEECYRQAPVTLTAQNLAESRQAELDGTPSLAALAAGGAELHELTIPGPAGAPEISLLVARPPGNEILPALFHTHGGGMVMGNNRTGLDTMIGWVTDPGLVIVSVEYRLAPEHPYPAGLQDCYAGLVWTAEHAAELGIDPERLIIGGGSAGGGLAAACALMARDRGTPALLAQMLIYPMLDDRLATGSSQELHGEGVWDSGSNLTAWTMLLGARRGGEDVPAYAAPARAADLSGLPPAYLELGSVETLRDEDLEYARRIWAAGGIAELHVWPGAFHAFDLIAPGTGLARAAADVRLGWLRRVLRG